MSGATISGWRLILFLSVSAAASGFVTNEWRGAAGTEIALMVLGLLLAGLTPKAPKR